MLLLAARDETYSASVIVIPCIWSLCSKQPLDELYPIIPTGVGPIKMQHIE